MAYVKTKKEVLRYVQSKTHAQSQQTLAQITAYEVSKELSISRALASQYLNELTKEGAVIKINSRPVYFLDRKTLEETHGVRLSFDSYLSISELEQALAKGNKGKHDFEKLIGSSSGLSYEVEQCKAAVKYPPRGLPILITGQNGTGKGFLASLTFEYAQNNGILTPKSTFQRFCCSEYEDTQQALDALFGLEGSADPHENLGALRRADGGILYLSDIQFLSREAQDKLAQLLDTGGYNTADQTGAMRESSARLILSSCEEPETHLSKRLLRRLPVVIHMPALSDRPVEEREQLILRFFCQESERMKKEIFISNRVFDTLLQYEFPANIEQLKNCIQSSCANALVQQEAQQDELLIYLYHLPEYLMVTARVDGRYSDEQRSMMNVRSFGKDTVAQTVGQYYDSILSEYDAYCSNRCDQDTLLRKLTQIFNDYSDYLVFSKRFANAKIDAIERVMETVFGVMSDKYYDSWGNEYVKVASGGGLVGLLFFIAIVWAVVKYVSSISEEIATAILAVAAIGSLVLSILCVVRHLRVYGYFSSAFIIFFVCLLIQVYEWDGFGNAFLICFISLFAFATAMGMKKTMIACFIIWLFCGFGSDTNLCSRVGNE